MSSQPTTYPPQASS